ncbi:MAG: capsule assembly Wzi family protein [Thermodesulfobacteriota bacterium]
MLHLRSRLGAAAIIAGLFLSAIPSFAGTDIPIDNPVYPLFDDLQYGGYLDSHLTGTRPITVGEARRLLMEAEGLRYDGPGGREAPYLALAMEEVDEELSRMLGDEAFQLKPISSPEIEFVYLEGEKTATPGMNVLQHSLVYNNDGVEPEEGSNGYLSFGVEGRAGPLSFFVSPLFRVDGTARGAIHKGYLKLSALGIDLEAGKIPLWWGQGRHGTLILSNNAEPLKMVRLTNPRPVLLPWFLKHLGPFRFDFFISRLEEQRAVPKPYITGIRVNFKPQRNLEIGLTRTTILGGEGRRGITIARFFDALFGENKPGFKDISNSIAGVDIRLTLPVAEIYGEIAGEDERAWLPSWPIAYIIGVYKPLLARNMDLRLEYADIRSDEWYWHMVNGLDHTYKGRVLGHHVGRGGRDLFFEVGLLKGKRLGAKIHLDYEDRGLSTQTFRERHFQAGTNMDLRIGRALAEWHLKVDLAYERIKNFGNVSGQERNNGLASVSIRGNI